MTIRQEIEADVRANNKVLASKVVEMTIIQLLRNCHYRYRSDYAHRLYRAGNITRNEAEEFTKIIGSD